MLFAITSSTYAVDSYRYAHVTIETPWSIFIFLLMIILFPFILMAVLYWYFAVKKPETKEIEK
jgi:ABC-type multidrug transport system permease subunit